MHTPMLMRKAVFRMGNMPLEWRIGGARVGEKLFPYSINT